jgi:molybdopterin-guanine dinucleotide biosynthesis protein A
MTVTVAVLAGGRGSRIGGDKALVRLDGRPLIDYPLSAAREAGLNAVVVAKRSTRLPRLRVPLLLEPDEPTHPLLGIVTALERHPAIIAIPCDMPFIEPDQLVTLAAMSTDVALLWHGEPFPALYRATSLPQLRNALDASASVRSTQAQAALASQSRVPMREVQRLAINTTDDLAAAERLLRQR